MHYIKTTPGQPEAYRPRRLAPDKLKAAKEEFDLLLQEGIIQPSKSPWSTPLHMIPKKTNAWRPCEDYRKLNARTIPDQHIEDFAQTLHQTQVFSTLDLVRAYNQIPVNPEDSNHYAIRSFRIQIYAIRPAERSTDIPKIHRRGAKGTSFRLCIYRRHTNSVSNRRRTHKAHTTSIFKVKKVRRTH